jgi:hypothetical protein
VPGRLVDDTEVGQVGKKCGWITMGKASENFLIKHTANEACIRTHIFCGYITAYELLLYELARLRKILLEVCE